MAEERNLGTARATEAEPDDDATKAELQRRMEQARESITSTVEEIKDTVSTQYQNVRETITQSLDWREQVSRRPAAFALGALGAGLIVGYSVGGVFKGDSELPERYYQSEGDDYGDVIAAAAPTRSYAAQPITGSSYGASAYTPTNAGGGSEQAARESVPMPATRPSYSSGYEAGTTSTEPEKPGLLSRFKETQAFDRLQQEVSTLGSRAVDELSKTAQTVVLPAILGKLKDMIGIDLSTQREVAQRTKLEQQTSTARADVAQSETKVQDHADGGGNSGGGASMGG